VGCDSNTRKLKSDFDDMPQFVVPQFIDVEDKIIGPITTRQFVVGVVAMLLLFISYRFSDSVLFAIQAILIIGLYTLIAFIKVNGQPFYTFVLSVIRSVTRSSLRVWLKTGNDVYVPKQKTDSSEDTAPAIVLKSRPQSHSLSELSLLVDTGGKYRSEELFQSTQLAKNQHAKK